MQPYNPRSDRSQAAYNEEIAGRKADFDLSKETILEEFEHWVIIENRFPYDNIARINHLLVSKEPISSIIVADQVVKNEYDFIMSQLASSDDYDAYIENFPKATTVKTHHHLHLIAWHNSA